MTLNATALRIMVEKGLTASDILEVVEAMEVRKDRTGAERQQRLRDRRAAERDDVTRDVTRDIAPPLLDKKEIPPTPPKEKINHSPRVCSALTRKAGGFGPPEGVEIDAWNAFAGQRRKVITRIAYDAICKKLTQSAEAGWPPGEMVATAIERGWETVFVPTEAPKDPRNGQSNFQPSSNLRGTRPDPAVDMYHRACEAIAAEGAAAYSEDYRGDWLSLPASGSG